MRIGLLVIAAFLMFPKQPEPPAVAWYRVSDRSRNTQVHLRTGSRLAPNFEMSADLLSALAHTLQAPVSLPSRCRNVGIDSRSIVANSQPQLTFCVCDFCFNSGRLGVPESVLQSFARDAVDVVSDDGMQLVWFALYLNAHCACITFPVPAAQFLPQSGNRLSQFVGDGCRRSQILDCVSALQDGLVGMIERFFQRLFRCAWWKHIARGLEMQH